MQGLHGHAPLILAFQWPAEPLKARRKANNALSLFNQLCSVLGHIQADRPFMLLLRRSMSGALSETTVVECLKKLNAGNPASLSMTHQNRQVWATLKRYI